MAIWRLPINLNYGRGGGPGVNVWHARQGSLDPGEELGDLSNMLHTFYSDIASGAISGSDGFQAGMTIDAGDWVDVDSEESRPADFDTITVPGTAPDAPPVLAVCMTWRTSIAARRGRGRTFLGPLSQNALQDNGTPDEDLRNVFATAAEDLVSASTGFGNGAWGVYGRTAVGASTHVLRDLTGFSVPNEFAVMRSRRD